MSDPKEETGQQAYNVASSEHDDGADDQQQQLRSIHRRTAEDITIGEPSLSGTDGFVYQGNKNQQKEGLAVCICDVNSDGFDDVLISSHEADVYVGTTQIYKAGLVYVLFGKASGWPSKVYGETPLTGTNGFTVVGRRQID